MKVSVDLVRSSNAKLLSGMAIKAKRRSSSLTQDMLNSFFKKAFHRDS